MPDQPKNFLQRMVATPGRRLTLLLIALGVLVYVPFAGNYGMWDPWETHYGEVARQMLERNDFVSQWWPGSPQDRNEFWSKPVLTFWLMAIGMKAFGLEWHPNAPADEIVTSWRVEWACRLPFVILGLIGVWATYELVRRLVSRRAAMLTGIILLTSSQWALISRQAMTDMAFVVPMTVALALAGLALLSPAEEVEAELPRRSLRVGPVGLSYPDAPAFRGFFWLTVLTIVPQLVVMSIQLKISFRLGPWAIRDLIGLVPMLPYWIALGLVWWGCLGGKLIVYVRLVPIGISPIKNLRELYITAAWLLCGLASLAKGPAGLAIPAIVMGVYLVVSGRLRDIWEKLEIPRGVLIFIATAFPWYHAMLIRHGMGFWNEFIGDNYVRRAGGRHGDRGTFEYYLQYIGYGMFPWSGFVAVGSLVGFRQLLQKSARSRVAAFAIVWALTIWALVTLVNTKFHHYILPALPPLAILAALCLDDLLENADRPTLVLMALIGVPITFVCGRDLAAFPARILWMFNYDYVNMPGTGRPWPLVNLYGDRYEYGTQLLVLAFGAALATIAVLATTRKRSSAPVTPDAGAEGPYRTSAGPPPPEPAESYPLGRALAAAAAFVGLLVLAIAFGPSLPRGTAPTIPRWLWLAPTLCMLPFTALAVRAGLGGLGGAARGAVLALSMFAVLWTGFLLDKIFVELSPHWAQKHVLAAYYANRRSAEEPLIAWQLYWRGENFYTKNEIYRSSNPNERTVFLGDRNIEKMQKWFAAHPGRRVFFIVERVRYESLRGVLPEKSRPTLQIVDQSNNKLYLAVAQL
jgi:4-amino-4-deoxy-L-arabinose transferase-like glycosyltransferase